MSIIVAIRSNAAVVVAADSQRVSAAGVSEAPFDKTFRLRGVTIGGVAGLLELSGKSIPERLIESLGTGSINPKQAPPFAIATLPKALNGLEDTEVACANRRLDIIFASRDVLTSTSFRPVEGKRRLKAETVSHNVSLVAGTPQAKAVAISRIERSKSIQALSLLHLTQLARAVINAAIGTNELHPFYPREPSCCLPRQDRVHSDHRKHLRFLNLADVPPPRHHAHGGTRDP
jgi:hypothetical protein